MFTHTDLQDIQFYAKILSLRRQSGEFWNSFLAGITKNPVLPPDPLEHLDLRGGSRSARVKATIGMDPDPTNPGTYRWGQRRMIPNPNEAERVLCRAVVHEIPMYRPEEKAPFSKHQSTTFVHVNRRITPQLFTSFSGVGNPCGVLIPAQKSFPPNPNNEYALLNRMIKYDAGTYGRPYDLGLRGLPRRNQLTSYEALYADPDLLGSTGKYTEILARLRWYNPLQSRETATLPQPAILICASNNSEVFYQSVLLSLRRAFDLKFALFRKFNVIRNIPLVIYDCNASTLDNVLKGYFILEDDENLDEFILQIINAIQPIIRIGITSTDVSWDKRIVMLQRGLDKLLKQQMPDENFDDILIIPNFQDSLLYLETLRALITYASRLVEARRPTNTLLHPNNPKYSTAYHDICIKYANVTDPKKEFQFFQFGFQSDFGELPPDQQTLKLNPRFLPENHPDRLFWYIAHGRGTAQALEIINDPTIDLLRESVIRGGCGLDAMLSEALRDRNMPIINALLKWHLRHHIALSSINYTVLGDLWGSLGQPSTCQHCHRNFKFLLFKRHHCRGCGDAVCENCSSVTYVSWFVVDRLQRPWFCHECRKIALAPI